MGENGHYHCPLNWLSIILPTSAAEGCGEEAACRDSDRLFCLDSAPLFFCLKDAVKAGDVSDGRRWLEDGLRIVLFFLLSDAAVEDLKRLALPTLRLLPLFTLAVAADPCSWNHLRMIRKPLSQISGGGY